MSMVFSVYIVLFTFMVKSNSVALNFFDEN